MYRQQIKFNLERNEVLCMKLVDNDEKKNLFVCLYLNREKESSE
jgi:hypothetical protein